MPAFPRLISPQRPNLIAMSPYLRTQQTAEPTMARFPDVPTCILPMQEFTYLEPSRWNGTARAERLPFIEGYWASGDPRHQDGPGAESFETLLARVTQTLDALAALPAGDLVYAFSHGQFMQSLRVALLHPGWSGEALMRHFWPFNQAHPILNVDQLVVTRRQGMWHTAAP